MLGGSGSPSGQKQPATQWSSQSWECSRLEQVSAQGEPHSRYCMLCGHVRAAGRRWGPCHIRPPPRDPGQDCDGAGAAGTLTAQARAPPVQGQPPGVGALARVLGEGVADAAAEVGALAEAEVLLAGLHEAAGIHQGVTAQEPLAHQELLAEALQQSRSRLSPGPEVP